MTEQALANIRVIDLSHYVAGPYCTKLLAGFGADVIKIERPGTGDPMRHVGPFYRDPAGGEHSIPFLWLNTGKKSVTLDLKTPGGVTALKDLVRHADVVVENFAPTVMRRLGLDYPVLRAVNPGLVMTAISNFGCAAPYSEFQVEEMQLYAMSGAMYLTGDPARAPLAPGPAICQYTGGLHAYLATLLALLRTRARGEGEFVDISLQESALENIEIALTTFLQAGKIPKRAKHMYVPWDLYECADGYAAITLMPARNAERAADIFPDPRLFRPPYRDGRERIRHRDAYEELLRPCLHEATKMGLFHAGQSRGLAFGALLDVAEALRSPQHAARGFLEAVDHPAVGRHAYLGAPFRMSRTPWVSGRAPLLGEHDRALTEIAIAHEQPPAVAGGDLPARARALPLAGVRVVDLSHSWAGPHCTRLLADFGADVVKVEFPRRLCLLRGANRDQGAYNRHPAWWQVNRNKSSIALDLRVPTDRAVLTDLLRVSDVLVENSRPGVLQRLGFGYEELARLAPELVVLAMPAFGSGGPYAGFVGYGAIMEAMSGIQSLTAYEPGGRPFRIKELDVTNGIMGACAVATALWHRQWTGRGQYIDLSQTEAASHALIGAQCLEHMMTGAQPGPVGNGHPAFAPHGCYRCQGEDKWVTITVRSEHEWARFCCLLGHPEWVQDARFATRDARWCHQVALDALIEAWTLPQTHYEVMHRLQATGIPAGAVLTAPELAEDPHLLKRGYFVTEGQPPASRFMGFPFRLAGDEPAVHWRGPDLGAQIPEVAGHLLGRPPAEWPTVPEAAIGTAYDGA